jgi:RNA polymerase sigma-70 factor (ECF subfamily)
MSSIWKNELRRLGLEREAADGMLPADNFDGERAIVGKILLTDVLKAMKRLPTAQAAAITLVNIEGLSYKDAAAVLEIPQGTLESRIVRGRIALGRLLEAAADDADRYSSLERRAEASDK